MHKPTDIGTNRTGIGTSPLDSRQTIKGAEEAGTIGTLDGKAFEAERVSWARNAEPVGTLPPPATVKGMVKTVVELVEGHKPTVFIDKLGERLAYERTGTRLYEALLAKYEAAEVHVGGPSRQELEQIRDDERNHVILVKEAMEYIGADPTAMTPGADIVGVAGSGWVQVLTDPRTTFTQCLDVILMAELTDVDSWTMLVELAGGLGFDDLADQFRTALVNEEDHLVRVRGWLTAAVLGQSGVAPTAEDDESDISDLEDEDDEADNG
ncbi:MAG: ferritin-like domain-containing protein [Deltaproteobacteria bacterium]|nr:ferritin-like domain-containing protein [Deltaproteobacteria bacterium]